MRLRLPKMRFPNRAVRAIRLKKKALKTEQAVKYHAEYAKHFLRKAYWEGEETQTVNNIMAAYAAHRKAKSQLKIARIRAKVAKLGKAEDLVAIKKMERALEQAQRIAVALGRGKTNKVESMKRSVELAAESAGKSKQRARIIQRMEKAIDGILNRSGSK